MVVYPGVRGEEVRQGAGEEVRQGAGRLAALGGVPPPPRGGGGCRYRGVIALCSDCRVLSVRAGGFLVYPGVRRRARAVVWLVCRWVVAGQETRGVLWRAGGRSPATGWLVVG